MTFAFNGISGFLDLVSRLGDPSGATSGSVIFADSSGNYAQDNANLNWSDGTNIFRSGYGTDYVGSANASTGKVRYVDPTGVYGGVTHRWNFTNSATNSAQLIAGVATGPVNLFFDIFGLFGSSLLGASGPIGAIMIETTETSLDIGAALIHGTNTGTLPTLDEKLITNAQFASDGGGGILVQDYFRIKAVQNWDSGTSAYGTYHEHLVVPKDLQDAETLIEFRGDTGFVFNPNQKSYFNALFRGSGNDVLKVDTTLDDCAIYKLKVGAGLVSSYNAITTVANGVPAEYAESDITAQSAAIAATTIYPVPASGAGMYRVSWVATITTAASVSSNLGGTAGFQLKYTDANDSVVKTENPTTPNVSAGNTTATSISGCEVAYCKASTNLQYLFGYSSTGVTAMQFNLHIKCEKL